MIKARVKAENSNANLKSYYDTYMSFDWAEEEKSFFHTADGHINIAAEAIDKWADDPVYREKPALVFEKGGAEQVFTYEDLRGRSAKWANLLIKYNFKIGDRIFIFLPSCPEIYFAMLACAKAGVIFSILYPTSGIEELDWRISNADPRGIITHPDLVNRLPRASVENIKHIFLTAGPKPDLFAGEAELDVISEPMPEEFENRFVTPDTQLYLIYTSGSTGPPKGVTHSHQDMYGLRMTAKYSLDVSPDSVLWTDADPAWVTGTVYSTFGPWLCGATSVVQGNSFAPELWYRTLERHSVTNWYTTPLTLRRLMAAGPELARQYDLSKLRHIATVGENLTPEAFYWVKEHLKHSAHDTWWMTETGMICISNFASQLVKPGSMGKPVPGIQAAVIDASGEELAMLTLGELGLKVGWPSMMREIWRDETRYRAYFRNGWFATGDMVIKDEDGYYYHMGRNDDLIKIGPNPVGPYDFEQVLCQHRAVAESAVISLATPPNPPIVKAFVKLNSGFVPSGRLRDELMEFLRNNFYCEIPDMDLEFISELPRTLSGKIVRRVLRARELGLPSGDPTKLKE
jgi:acetyl-CoA synthetase